MTACRSSISFETSQPPREDSFDNFREVDEDAQSIDIGRVFDSNKKEIVRAFDAGIQEVEEEPDIEYSIYTIGGGNDTERRQNKRPFTAAVVEIRNVFYSAASLNKAIASLFTWMSPGSMNIAFTAQTVKHATFGGKIPKRLC